MYDRFEMKLKGNLIALVASIAHIGLTTFHPAIVLAESPQGQLIFETKCVGCHENGGNVLSPAKTLQLGALERNGYSSIDSIIELTRNGKGQVSDVFDSNLHGMPVLCVSGSWSHPSCNLDS